MYIVMASDAHIITGIGSIMNPYNINQNIDINEVERAMISGGIITSRPKDPQDRFNDELRDAAKKLGISFGDAESTAAAGAGMGVGAGVGPGPSDGLPALRRLGSPQPSARPLTPMRVGTPLAGVGANNAYTTGPGIGSTPSAYTPQPAGGDDESDDEGDRADMVAPSATTPQSRFGGERPRFGAVTPTPGGDLYARTQEQERRSHIDSIMGAETSSISFEEEKREDMKYAMLAQIDCLLTTLTDEGVDLSRVSKVDKDSSFANVETVLKILRYKSDHTRYCSLAEEFLLFGAYALEELFDGKRMWLGRYQPDLTGWPNIVNIKLQRMRNDTGPIVSEVMQNYNIGPGMRILLELLPSLILHSRVRRQQHGDANLFSDADMAAAKGSIRGMTA